jgi:hypothetical protein
MPLPPVTVRPIVQTAHVDDRLGNFRVLGARVFTSDPLWAELQTAGPSGGELGTISCEQTGIGSPLLASTRPPPHGAVSGAPFQAPERLPAHRSLPG